MTVTEISILDTASQPARESGSVRAAGGGESGARKFAVVKHLSQLPCSALSVTAAARRHIKDVLSLPGCQTAEGGRDTHRGFAIRCTINQLYAGPG